MDAFEMVSSLVPGTTVRELSGHRNRIFRLLEESGRSTIVKVYATPARERRERHALEALANVPGIPTILERGSTAGMPWIRMNDGGGWNLATLPHNLEAAKKAGALLRGVHEALAPITNLEGGLDADYVRSHYASTIERLGRYRRRAGIPPEVLEAARHAPAPESSEPRPAHTRPEPRNFVVAEDGTVTLIDWEWATLAPPEWDLSLATWRFDRELGEDAASALWAGYGASFPQHRLRPWIAYHAAMMLLDAAEQRDGRLGDLAYLVDDLAAAVS